MVSNGYYIDLAAFSLDTLKDRLRGIHLSPGQQILLEDMDARFASLNNIGISNLEQLHAELKNKNSMQIFSQRSGLPASYLTILRRWVNGYFPKPVKLDALPAVDAAAIHKLAEMGIKDTLQLFALVKSPQFRSALEKQSGLPTETVLLLAKFTDLVRLKWVGPKFAHLLIVSGFDSVKKVAKADGEALYAHLQQVKAESAAFQGNFSLDDIRLWIKYIVCDVPISMEF